MLPFPMIPLPLLYNYGFREKNNICRIQTSVITSETRCLFLNLSPCSKAETYPRFITMDPDFPIVHYRTTGVMNPGQCHRKDDH